METVVNGSDDWFYYAVPAADIGNFSLSINADNAVSTYVLKTSTDPATLSSLAALDNLLPDAQTFDMLLKNEKRVTLNSNLMDFDKGAIVAVHCNKAAAISDKNFGDSESASTTFKVQLNMLKDPMAASDNGFGSGFLDLAASAVPASAKPKPTFENGEGGADDKQGGGGAAGENAD